VRITDEDTPATIAVLSNDTDPDGDHLSVIAVTGPAHGSTLVNPDGTVTYTPALNFNGVDSFTYTIADGRGGMATAAVNVTITPVNDAPVLTVPGAQETAEDIAVTIAGIAVADVDVLEGTGAMRVTLAVGSGTLAVLTDASGGLSTGQVAGNGTSAVVLEGPISAVNATLAAGVTYLGNLNFHGTDTLMVTADDLGNTGAGGPLTDVQAVTIRVLSPSEQVAELRAMVLALSDTGALNKGQSNSLLAKLDQADSKIAGGQTKVAYNVIGPNPTLVLRRAK
jgi:VCBS repeat-containing protein